MEDMLCSITQKLYLKCCVLQGAKVGVVRAGAAMLPYVRLSPPVVAYVRLCSGSDRSAVGK